MYCNRILDVFYRPSAGTSLSQFGMLHKLRASTVSIRFAFAAILLPNFQIHVVNPIRNHPINQPLGW